MQEFISHLTGQCGEPHLNIFQAIILALAIKLVTDQVRNRISQYTLNNYQDHA